MKINNQTIRIPNTKDGYLYQFQTKTSKYYNDDVYTRYYTLYNDLQQCYNNYSVYKERAFDYCMNIVNKLQENCENVDIIRYGISSYNCMQFTFEIYIRIDEKPFTIRITKDNNYIISTKENIKYLLNTLEKITPYKLYHSNDCVYMLR